MDIWQSADPRRVTRTGWLGRAATEIHDTSGNIAILQIGPNRQPLALSGAPGGGAVSVNDSHSFRLELGGGTASGRQGRRRLLEEVSAPSAGGDDLLSFVQRRQVQTLTAVEKLRELLEGPGAVPRQGGGGLYQKLQLVAGLVAKGFGTRIFYVSLEGFDTHADQGPTHNNLLGELANAVNGLFQTLKTTGHDKRVALLTFSEFGRRVQENGSRGTDHGAASCLFVAGPALKGGVVGKHPSLSDLDAGDLKFHTDFRRVYATLLDGWLGCDSKAVLGGAWEHVKELEAKS
jgi:uncharacterized protein (DUF1501 family)